MDQSGGATGLAGQSTSAGGQASNSGGLPSSGGGGQSSGAGGQAGSSGGKPSSGGQVASAGEGGNGAEPDEPPSVSEIMDEYRTWQPQSAQPMPISAYIFGLCRLPTLAEQEFSESEHGDGRYLQDWANTEAQAGIARRGAPPFDEGAVIVKEKYVNGAEGLELVAIAMMIKREPGFAPAQGDWDYAYYEPQLGTIQTQEQSTYCSGCHSGASATDYVFVDGLEPGK